MKKTRKNSFFNYRTQPIKKFNKKRIYLKANEQPPSPMNTTQFILNSTNNDRKPMDFEFNGDFGSMLGLINDKSLVINPKNEQENDEIDGILKDSVVQNNPQALIESIERLAKIIREKEGRIEELQRNFKEEEKNS